MRLLLVVLTRCEPKCAAYQTIVGEKVENLQHVRPVLGRCHRLQDVRLGHVVEAQLREMHNDELDACLVLLHSVGLLLLLLTARLLAALGRIGRHALQKRRTPHILHSDRFHEELFIVV